ncbi:MAG: phosphatidate cytidylyltransferase [Burkholderiaceae bacterium]|jgi:phosphatidate cytidylyltransferase|nr:phosphatidate cytidylyltransferase [Burkholderiaceae bacterium]
MLKTRIVTALCLLAALLAVLFFPLACSVFLLLLFLAAAWENCRLFDNRHPLPVAIGLTLLFLLCILWGEPRLYAGFAVFSVAAWLLYFFPTMALPLPMKGSLRDRVLELIYFASIAGAFLSFLYLYERSRVYLFSSLILVNLADVGAYVVGRAFGRHKLAPAISPGKTWEGAFGGGLTVLVASAAFLFVPAAKDCVTTRIYAAYGWGGLLVGIGVLVSMSIVGDLHESRLKRRRGFKDSSHLLPGHGGVLDRFDSLIPVFPLSVLVYWWT